jgi:hypothetical protein
MSTFSVDPAAVIDMAGRLLGLRQEFDDAGDITDGYEDAIGFDDLSHEVHEFATNWSDKKRKVGELIGEVAGAAQIAGDAYQALEAELSGAFEDAGAPSGSTAGGSGPR